ncbi:NTP transferase domain-containing protein [Helicobacter sp. L8]|uniref:NTP transferase domain-containing protein n=1 Tax=Helicobacter sp. L8 TaxID=2316078 RepID=UPI000EACB3CC|nr:NTP transferase domain-containing protein [Helicobacter sp. L8]
MTKLKIPCVILTGGKSARMRVGGQQCDKALLPFGNYPSLLAYQHAKMSALFERVYISCKESYNLQVYASYILDCRPDFSPLLGIVRSLYALRQTIFVIPVDMPLVSAQSILKLCERAQEAGVVYAKSPERFYLLGCWQMSMADALEDTLESNGSVSSLLEGGLAVEVSEGVEFSNCNTYREYQRALKILNG